MMSKKSKFAYVLLGAVLLAFAGCADSTEEVVDNPYYNAEDNSVFAQFVFNVSTGNTENVITRQTADDVQVTTNKFRGMNNVHIMAYTLGTDGTHVSAPDSAARDYDLSALLSSGQITDAQSRRVVELSLPVGTNTLMFYGKAPMTAADNADTGLKKEDQQGSVTFSPAADARNTSFQINSRLNGNQDVFTQSADMLATILTRIAQNGLHQETAGEGTSQQTRDFRYAFWWDGAKATDATSDERNKIWPTSGATLQNKGSYTKDGKTQTLYADSLEWYELGDKYEKHEQLTALEEILGNAYHTFTTINKVGEGKDAVTEIRAGSAPAILRLVQDLWTVTDKVKDAVPTSPEEYIAKKLAERISTRFNTYFDISTDGSRTVTYKKLVSSSGTKDGLKDQIAQYVHGKKDSYDKVAEIATFPQNLNLPLGAAQLTFTKEKESTDADGTTTTRVNEFSYVTDLPTYGMGGGADGTTTVDAYLYPAELCYFGNSPVWVTDDTHKTTDYPLTVNGWATEKNWKEKGTDNTALYGEHGWQTTHVQSSTRSVAMKHSINYGTSLLQTTVRYGDSELLDNNHAIHPTEEDQKIAVTDASFLLTGVIVGGMCNEVGWNFVQKAGSENFKYMVYDKAITSRNIPNFSGTVSTGDDGVRTVSGTPSKSESNYTLLWDNYQATPQPVYVALEFLNNTGMDFWGNANLVRDGGTFYLIGKLDPAPLGTAKNFPTLPDNYNYALPPYVDEGDDKGATDKTVRVFIQDFMTTADFVIGRESLKKAYVTVPDLRSSQISLGMSVDIKWETGLNFEDVILGQ